MVVEVVVVLLLLLLLEQVTGLCFRHSPWQPALGRKMA